MAMRIDRWNGRRVAVTALAMIGWCVSAGAQTESFFAKSQQYPLLPRDLETELALSAAPPHLRDGANVMVLEPTGYATAVRKGNAFTCMVSRRGGDLFPVCWDAEGVRSLLPL